MILGGIAAIDAGFKDDKEKGIHKASLSELADSFEGEMTPLLVDVDGKVVQLTGSAEGSTRSGASCCRRSRRPTPPSRRHQRRADGAGRDRETLSAPRADERPRTRARDPPGLTLLRPLGRGGMGEAWLARDAERGSDVVAKLVPAGAAPERVALLRREARLVRKLDHPRIVAVYGFRDGARGSAVTLRYMPGGDAARRRGAPAAEVVALGRDVADALEYLHGLGVVHRDVKPSNVLLDERGRAHLADFGIAAVAWGEEDGIVLRGGGSRASMSPQQRAGEPAQPADDLYALGVPALRAALRAPSLPREASDEETAAAPPPVASPLPVPDALRGLVARLLAKSPERPALGRGGARRARGDRGELARVDAGRRAAVRLQPPPRVSRAARSSGRAAGPRRRAERPAARRPALGPGSSRPARCPRCGRGGGRRLAAALGERSRPATTTPAPAPADRRPCPRRRGTSRRGPAAAPSPRPAGHPAARRVRPAALAPRTRRPPAIHPASDPLQTASPKRRRSRTTGTPAGPSRSARTGGARSASTRRRSRWTRTSRSRSKGRSARRSAPRSRTRSTSTPAKERLSTQAVAREAEAAARARPGRGAGGAAPRARRWPRSKGARRARTPVAVVIESDGLTELTLSRVGPLGTLTRRSVDLAPGSTRSPARAAATGTCAGSSAYARTRPADRRRCAARRRCDRPPRPGARTRAGPRCRRFPVALGGSGSPVPVAAAAFRSPGWASRTARCSCSRSRARPALQRQPPHRVALAARRRHAAARGDAGRGAAAGQTACSPRDELCRGEPDRAAGRARAPAARRGPGRRGAEDAAITPVGYEPRPLGGARGRGAARAGRCSASPAARARRRVAPRPLAAGRVGLAIDPEPDTVALRGRWPDVRLGSRFVALRGPYTLVAEKEGYRRLEAPVEVTGEAGQVLRARDAAPAGPPRRGHRRGRRRRGLGGRRDAGHDAARRVRGGGGGARVRGRAPTATRVRARVAVEGRGEASSASPSLSCPSDAAPGAAAAAGAGRARRPERARGRAGRGGRERPRRDAARAARSSRAGRTGAVTKAGHDDAELRSPARRRAARGDGAPRAPARRGEDRGAAARRGAARGRPARRPGRPDAPAPGGAARDRDPPRGLRDGASRR